MPTSPAPAPDDNEISNWLTDDRASSQNEVEEAENERVLQSPNWDGIAETYDLAQVDTVPDAEPGALPPKIGGRKKKKRSSESSDSEWATRRVVYEKPQIPTGRPWLLWVFAACLLPLAIDVLIPERTIHERIAKATADDPRLQEKYDELPEIVDIDSLLSIFPDDRLPGAALARDSSWHYAFALISAVCFLGLILAAWPDEEVSPQYLIGMGVLTGTVGIALLLAVQFMGEATQHFTVHGRGVVALLFLVLHFIGYSYRCAIDPSIGFLMSLFGFTFGVGLCEELCKAVPIVLYLRGQQRQTWRGTAVVGFASGIGFGVSEGISYSADMYNGIALPMTYAVRFLSCVTLHAVWAGIVGLLMYRDQSHLTEIEGSDVFLFVVKYMGIAMVLHALYDVLLKFDHEVIALTIAVASFVWLLFLVRRQQVEEAA